MIRETLEVGNRLGLHARAAAKLVRLSSGFASEVSVSREGTGLAVDAKSILGVLMLAASKGTRLEFTADGPDESEVITAVRRLFEARFGEEA
jgi:phosphocarrier protein HPr